MNNKVKLLFSIFLMPLGGSELFAMGAAQQFYEYVEAQCTTAKTISPSQVSNGWISENKGNNLERARILLGHVCPASTSDAIPAFNEWKKRCDTNIAHFKDTYKSTNKFLHDYSKTTTNYQEFMKAVNAFMVLHKEQDLVNGSLWVNNDGFDAAFFDGAASFKPFTQALRVAPGTEIVMFGDRHGDVRSTLEMINELSTNANNYFEPNSFKLKSNILLVGLGDYVDRGNAGVETLLTVLWLKLQNPAQVILVRGNHEDCGYSVNKSQFQFELKSKLGKEITQQDIEKINRIYDCMPVAVFIGSGDPGSTHFMIGCHGFLEVGYHPRNLLDMVMHQELNVPCFEKIGLLQRKNNISNLPEESQKAIQDTCKSCAGFARELGDSEGTLLTGPSYPYRLGWMWSYALDNGSKPLGYDTVSHTWQWGKGLTEDVLNDWSKPGEYTISWLFRGHQHSHNEEYRYYPATMNNLWKNNGLYKLWSEPGKEHSLESRGAFTLCVAPDNIYAGTNQKIYPGFNYDTWISVKTGVTGVDWKVKVFNKAMFALPECPVKVDGALVIPQKPYKAPAPMVFEKNRDNFYAVEPGVLYRTKLLPTKILEQYVKKYGIKTIINLREPDLGAAWYQEEVALCQRLGITLYNLNFHPKVLPTKEQLIQLFNLFDERSKHPILVHCLAGADRTGLVSALYVADKMQGTLEQSLKQQDAFFGHNSHSFPHLRKLTHWWIAMQQKFDGDRTAILAAYDPVSFMAGVAMPASSVKDLEGRV